MKCCTKCNTEKPYEMFTKEKSTKDGFSRWCKSCRKEYKETDIAVNILAKNIFRVSKVFKGF